jgi:hypothetical protein
MPSLRTFDYLRRERCLQRDRCMRVDALEQDFIGAGEGGQRNQNVASRPRKFANAALNGIRKAVRHWNRFTCLDSGWVFEDELADLQRKKRVAARHSKDMIEFWPPEWALQPQKHQVIDRVQREWPDLKAFESTLTESLLQYGIGIAG